ncbi:MAG: FAD:protein FMN transferase [Solirubrobacterales bacterium]
MFLAKRNSYYKFEKTFTALGTINTITAYGKRAEQAVYAAHKRVLEIDDRMSAFKEGSDVMKINRNAGIKPENINRDTFNLIKESIKFSELSNGTFDITVRPLTYLWGFSKKNNFIPNNEEVVQALSKVNYKDILLDDENCTVFLQKEGQAIDLGSIAKGYATDEVKRIFFEHKIKNSLINLGGNVAVSGHNSNGNPWSIGIQDPTAERGSYVGTIKAVKGTIVTSGSNEQFFIKDGIRYHHILDPKTGFPADTNLLSVTVFCESSMAADALTTALFISGLTDAMRLLKAANAEAVLILDNLHVFVTEGLRRNFELSSCA